MAKSYQQLQSEIETLQKKAEAVRKQELAAVVKELKQAIAYWGLTAEDLGLQQAASAGKSAGSASRAKRKAPTATAKKVATHRRSKPAAAAKYRDENGNTWGGRGPRPRWIKAALESGRTLEEFSA